MSQNVDEEGPNAYKMINKGRAASPTQAFQHGKATRNYPAIFYLWKSPRFNFALFATICRAIAITSLDGALPVYVKDLFGFNSMEIGILYMALTVPAFIQPFVGRLVGKHGGRFIGTIGFLLSCSPLVGLWFVEHGSLTQKVLLVVLLALVGAALAMTLPVYVSEVSCVVLGHQKHGLGSYGTKGALAQPICLWSAAYSIGCTIGPLWGGWIQKAAGWKTETWTIGLLCGFVAIPAALFTGGTNACTQRWAQKTRYN